MLGKEKKKKLDPAAERQRLNEGNLSIQPAGLQKEEEEGNWELKASRRHGRKSWKELEAGEDEASEVKLPYLRAEQRVRASPPSRHIPLLQRQVFCFFFHRETNSASKTVFLERRRKKAAKRNTPS